MNFKNISLLLFLCGFFNVSVSSAQEKELYKELYNSYEDFKEESIEQRRFTHS
jgi:hypothetical protein